MKDTQSLSIYSALAITNNPREFEQIRNLTRKLGGCVDLKLGTQSNHTALSLLPIDALKARNLSILTIHDPNPILRQLFAQ